jgi:hypothetical protein
MKIKCISSRTVRAAELVGVPLDEFVKLSAQERRVLVHKAKQALRAKTTSKVRRKLARFIDENGVITDPRKPRSKPVKAPAKLPENVYDMYDMLAYAEAYDEETTEQHEERKALFEDFKQRLTEAGMDINCLAGVLDPVILPKVSPIITAEQVVNERLAKKRGRL